ncbi:helix-hairpin-helix domain-containing protein [Halococcus salsus]|uniref:helix-hairpin-helix domain-containing protein n=1 Tax=Halococcus salsus TaxID=2162894 RepID=UPI001F03F553|nr:helix-hairpin-helix domain-containing protein [Halococcus salsus]
MDAIPRVLYHTLYVVMILFCGVWFGIQYATGTSWWSIIYLALLVVLTAVGILQYESPERTDDTTIYDVEAAREAYTEGRITLTEMERRVNIALDPESKQLRRYVEEVKGVGPEISAALSAEYSSTEELSKASKSDLEEIYGIGPNTARAIKQQFNHQQVLGTTDET